MRTTITTTRRRVVRGVALGAVLAGLLGTSVSAATTQVEATDDKAFAAPNVTTTVGGSVHWFGTPGGSDLHSVRQNAGLFDSGTPATALDYTRTFSAGTFGYHCEEHLEQAMVGQVRVPAKVLARPAGLPFTVRWATPASNTGSRYDVQYRVGSGAWKSWKSRTWADSAVFGARSRPVRVARGRTYSFRVVSRSATGRLSAPSPVTTFRP